MLGTKDNEKQKACIWNLLLEFSWWRFLMRRVHTVLSSLMLLPFLWSETLLLFCRSGGPGVCPPCCRAFLVFLLDYLCPLTATPVTVFPLRLSCHLSAESLGHQLLSFWKKSGCWPPSYHLGLLNKAEWQMRHLEGLGSDPSGKGMPLCTFKRWMTIWPGKDTHFTFPLAQDWNHLPLSSVWIKW